MSLPSLLIGVLCLVAAVVLIVVDGPWQLAAANLLFAGANLGLAVEPEEPEPTRYRGWVR